MNYFGKSRSLYLDSRWVSTGSLSPSAVALRLFSYAFSSLCLPPGATSFLVVGHRKVACLGHLTSPPFSSRPDGFVLKGATALAVITKPCPVRESSWSRERVFGANILSPKKIKSIVIVGQIRRLRGCRCPNPELRSAWSFERRTLRRRVCAWCWHA